MARKKAKRSRGLLVMLVLAMAVQAACLYLWVASRKDVFAVEFRVIDSAGINQTPWLYLSAQHFSFRLEWNPPQFQEHGWRFLHFVPTLSRWEAPDNWDPEEDPPGYPWQPPGFWGRFSGDLEWIVYKRPPGFATTVVDSAFGTFDNSAYHERPHLSVPIWFAMLLTALLPLVLALRRRRQRRLAGNTGGHLDGHESGA